MLTKHSSLFKDELGTIKGVTAKVYINPSAKPRFFRPRAVPYALRPKVDQALEKLEAAGIVERFELSEWAAPIVPVVKRDGTIRVCGDYKLTVNQATQVDTYPLPLVDSLFASLAGETSFSKLDLAHANQQLCLDEDSRRYVTINTHKGLFQYARLPFGVDSAPAIFQRTMELLLRGLPHVCVYLDDILVTGESDTHPEPNSRAGTAGVSRDPGEVRIYASHGRIPGPHDLCKRTPTTRKQGQGHRGGPNPDQCLSVEVLPRNGKLLWSFPTGSSHPASAPVCTPTAVELDASGKGFQSSEGTPNHLSIAHSF